MVRRVLSVLFTLGAPASLGMCASASVLWGRSYRNAPAVPAPHPTGRTRVFRSLGPVTAPASDSFSRVVRGARYTARSEAGRIRLFAPPPVPPAAYTPIAPGEPSPAALVAGISDRHIEWQVARYWNGERPSYRLEASVQVWPRTPTGAVFNTLEGGPMPGASSSRTQRPFTAAEFSIPLLAALDDPDRFLVAHLLESEASTLPMAVRGRLPVSQGLTPPGPDASFDLMVYDVRVRLRPRKPFGPKPPGGDPEFELCTASLAPTDAAALRDGWHRRLDVPVVSVAHWQVVAMTALLPLFWSFRRIRSVLTRRHRRRQGLCLRCGYDVRASPERCPECGKPIPAMGRTISGVPQRRVLIVNRGKAARVL